MILDFKPVGACAQSCDSNRFVNIIQEQGFIRSLLIIQSASIYLKHVGRSKEKFLDKFLYFAEPWDLGKELKESICYHIRKLPWLLGKKLKGKDTLEVVSLSLLSLDSKRHLIDVVVHFLLVFKLFYTSSAEVGGKKKYSLHGKICAKSCLAQKVHQTKYIFP